MTTAEECLIVGLGNDYRGDDAVGLWVARQLRDRLGCKVIENRGDLAEVIDQWAGVRRVFVIDALGNGAHPGALHIIDGLSTLPREKRFRCSSHGQGILALVELARALDRLPRQLKIIAIEGKCFAHGAELSREARAGAERALMAIIQEVSSLEQEATNA